MFWVTFTALFFFDPSCYSEIMCVLYHYIKVSLTWESEVYWLRNKKKIVQFYQNFLYKTKITFDVVLSEFTSQLPPN